MSKFKSKCKFMCSDIKGIIIYLIMSMGNLLILENNLSSLTIFLFNLGVNPKDNQIQDELL